MTFWEIFYNLCIQNGTKPNPVAKEIGLSSATCTQWKKGAVPSSSSVAKIAEYFGVSVNYLLGTEKDKTKNIVLSPKEVSNIQKYRSLDEIGVKAVDGLLDIEYERCTEHKPMDWAVPPVDESKAVARAEVDTHTLNDPPDTEDNFVKIPVDEV